jgi:hypothetical protein
MFLERVVAGFGVLSCLLMVDVGYMGEESERSGYS